MYYLCKDTSSNDYVIRSFPHEACSSWTDDIKKAFNIKRKMRLHTSITADTIEEYLQTYTNTLVVLVVWDTCPTLEQAYLDYPEFFI